jgi:hypothetical protein
MSSATQGRSTFTPTQFKDAWREIELVKAKLQKLHEDACRTCGDDSRVALRAEECANAVQRLEWELQRLEP